MRFVERILQRAAALGLVHRAAHRGRDRIRVQHDHAVLITRGAADGLDERGLRAQEALLVRVQDCDKRHLRDVQTLAQQVDADQHVEHAETQVAHQLLPLDGLDVMMHVTHLDARGFEIVGQVLGHLFGQSRDKHALTLGRARVDLTDQVVDLPVDRAHHDLRVKQAGRADDLLDHLPGAGQLVLAGRRRNINDLI